METVRLDVLIPREVARKQSIKKKRRGDYLAQSIQNGEIYVADDMDPLIGALNEGRHPEHRLKRSNFLFFAISIKLPPILAPLYSNSVKSISFGVSRNFSISILLTLNSIALALSNTFGLNI